MEHEFIWFVFVVFGFAFGLIIYLIRDIQQKERKYIEIQQKERKYIEERERKYIEVQQKERKYIEQREMKYIEECGRKDLLMEKLIEKLHKQTSEYILDKDVMTKKNDKQKDHIHKLEKEALQLGKSLEDIQRDYLYATKKLSARGALELFQKRFVFKNKNRNELSALQMWEEFLKEDMGKAFLAKMKEEN